MKLTTGEQARIFVKGTDNLSAYLKLLEGQEYTNNWTKENIALAQKKFEEAIDIDPEYAAAYAQLALTHYADSWYGSKDPLKSRLMALELAEKSNALDDSYPLAYSVMGLIQLNAAQAEKAITLAPNSATAYLFYGMVLRMSTLPAKSIPPYEKAICLNPIPRAIFFHELGLAYLQTGRLEEAIDNFKKAINRSPKHVWPNMSLIWAYNELGREEDARKVAAEFLKIDPDFSIERDLKGFAHKRFIDSLRKAGLK